MNFLQSVLRRLGLSRDRDKFEHWTQTHWAPDGYDTRNYFVLALQPIFDRKKRIFGYEVLSRSEWDDQFHGGPDAATQIIDDGVLRGLDELTRGNRIFLNCTRAGLLGGMLTLLPAASVLALLESDAADKEVLAACRRMKALGYEIALDYFPHTDMMNDLIRLADYVKVDFGIFDQPRCADLCHRLQERAITPVAVGIETREEFVLALEEGFQLFQGYYLAPPTVWCKCRTAPRFVNRFAFSMTLN